MTERYTWKEYVRHCEIAGPELLLETALLTEHWPAKDYGLLVQRMRKIDADRYAAEPRGRRRIDPPWRPTREQVRALVPMLMDDGITVARAAELLGVGRNTVKAAILAHEAALEAASDCTNGET